jgi:hypothetical protein
MLICVFITLSCSYITCFSLIICVTNQSQSSVMSDNVLHYCWIYVLFHTVMKHIVVIKCSLCECSHEDCYWISPVLSQDSAKYEVLFLCLYHGSMVSIKELWRNCSQQLSKDSFLFLCSGKSLYLSVSDLITFNTLHMFTLFEFTYATLLRTWNKSSVLIPRHPSIVSCTWR